MEQQFFSEVLEKLKQKRRKKAWKWVLSVMMCTVVFCTTYMLILPAITKENSTFCGIEEHSHSEKCYEEVLNCLNHIHNDECYSLAELICTEETNGGHTHSEACSPLSETSLTCNLAESEAHIHTESCNSTESVLNCLEDHEHVSDCYTSSTSLICGFEESEGHTHGDSCYTVTTTHGCGSEESPPTHSHTEACYTVPNLLCEIETDAEHQHTETCYSKNLICALEEHTHTIACFSNPNADLESSDVWEATLPELTGNYSLDIIAIAESQLGYTESSRNYIVDENGNIKGYTRYGEWYGDHYGDWCAMFASFCLHYAGAEEVPLDASCSNWVNELAEKELYDVPSEYIPKSGDIIFFDMEEEGSANHVGLVSEVIGTELIAIEGNSDNRVSKNKYDLLDNRIVGYGMISKLKPAAVENSLNGFINTSHSLNTFNLNKLVSTYANEDKIGVPLDLKNYIDNVVMYDSNGNVIPNGATVTEGDEIRFQINFTIPNQQFGIMNPNDAPTVYTDTLTYKLPDSITVVRSDSGYITNSGSQIVGTYVIDSNTGTITMVFYDEYVEQNINGLPIDGFISFFSTVTKITDNDSEDQNHEFKEGLTLGVIIEEKVEAVGDLVIEKKKTDVVGEEIEYEIKVTSAEGTNGPITITDTMTDGLTFKEGISIEKGSGASVNASFNVSADKSSFTMTLPEMAAGESYVIKYRCTADINLLGADMTVHNTATVTGKDSQNNELKDEVTVDHTFNVLEKTGVDNGDGTITWTITINQDKTDISGWILDDKMGNVTYQGTVSIKDSSGKVVASNVKLPYTFPNGSKDTYTVTYTTPYDYSAGTTIYNTAILRDNNTDVTDVEGVNIGIPVTKSGTIGEIIQDANGTNLVPVTWTVTIDTTKGQIPAGTVLNDMMEDWTANEMYMTYDQLMAAYENIAAELVRVGSGTPTDFEATVYDYGMDKTNNGSHSYNELINNINGSQSKVYEGFSLKLNKSILKGNLLTFTYEAYGIFENNVIAGSIYTNQFKIGEDYNAMGSVELTSGAVKAKKMALNYYDPVAHKDLYWFWSLYDDNGTDGTTELAFEKLKDGYLAWTIELSVPPNYLGKGDVILYENLPDGVAIKGLTLPFFSNIPTKPLELWDIEAGQTYSWDFTLYPADQIGGWNPQGGQLVSIKIEVTEDWDLKITIPGIIFETMAQRITFENQWMPEGYKYNEWYGYLHIFTQIDEEIDWLPDEEAGKDKYFTLFQNQFTLENEDGDVLDLGSQTQRITKDESTGNIRKEATTDNNNIVSYSVLLNAYGKDLVENSDVINVHDELTYLSTDSKPLRVRLVPGSVKLYEVETEPSGKYTKGREVTINYSYEETPTTQNGTTTWHNTIDFTISDGKAYLFEYAYKANGSTNMAHEVLNTCTIQGVGQGNLNGNHKLELEVKQAAAQADTAGIILYKVDANSDGVFLPGAKFNIYIWNENEGKYIIVNHSGQGTEFVTNSSGMIVIDSSTLAENQFAYNTAYYIVEVESPNGYYLSPEPYYFMITNPDYGAYPVCKPDDFNGHMLTRGDIIYRKNVSATTEINVEKYWKNYNGEDMTITANRVPNITLELWQEIEGKPNSAKLYGTYIMTPDKDGNWKLTITGLPKTTDVQTGSGGSSTTRGENYVYYIKEVNANGFTLESAQNNDGIKLGTIKLTNREVKGYVLPETGGIGKETYIIAGLILTLFSAGYLLHTHRKRRREESS